MMKSLRLRRIGIPTSSSSSSTTTTRIRTRPHEPPEFAVDVADADADAALLRPIAEDGSSAETAADVDVVAKGRESLMMMKSGRSPSLASLATCTTESSSSMHSAIEDMSAMTMPMGANDDDDDEDGEAGGDGVLDAENHRQPPTPPTSASAASRRRIIRIQGRRQGQGGGCLRIKTQQASLQQKYTTSKQGTTSSSAFSCSFSSRAKGKDRTEYFDAESELELKTVVGFSHITVHSHQLILGDNPSPAVGPPVSIAWTAFDTATVPVDDYEKNRSGPPRHHSELQAPGALRTAWLLRAGYTPEEIATAEKQIRLIQRRRRASLPSSHSSLPVHSPYSPCGKANLQVRNGVAKLLPRAWARRRKAQHDDDSVETGAATFVDEAQS
jgi:hypothetical protein